MASFLRLGSKYEIPRFRTEAVKRLLYEYPQNIHALDTIHHNKQIRRCSSYADEFFTTINLVRRYNVPEVLPWAFYACCLVLSKAEIKRSTEPSLSIRDREICIKGRKHVLGQQALAWIYSACPSEKEIAQVCNAARRSVLKRDVHPLDCMALVAWDATWQRRLCQRCKVTAKASHNASRQIIWNKLPSFFGLPEWTELMEE